MPPPFFHPPVAPFHLICTARLAFLGVSLSPRLTYGPLVAMNVTMKGEQCAVKGVPAW